MGTPSSQRSRRVPPVVRDPPRSADRPGHHRPTCHVDHPVGLIKLEWRDRCMTGHAFQALIDDETAVASLSTMAAHLEPDGMVSFETRNPLRRVWERWKPDRARTRVTHASLGSIIETHDATYEGDTGIVRIRHEYRFESTGKILVGSSRIRFRDQEHVETLVREAGLSVDACLGDWSGAPFSSDKETIIVVASATP